MADTRQFTDHNEIGGVNVYLEDKKLAESPEQNTVATTDYVLLKDTDGVPHKISKANMMSVVKDALADLLKNNDLGTSVTKVPALNASAFGSATVANLASVLGASKAISNGTNLNDLKTSGWWSKLSGVNQVTGGPVANTAFFMYVCKSPDNYVIQTYYEWNGDVYYRRLDNNTWSEWTMISVQKFLRPYTDLNGLASALGVYHSSMSTWDVTKTLDTGIKANVQTLLLLFRCQTSSADGDFYSFIIPITVGNLKAGIWRGDAISIRENSQFPTSAIQFSVSNNNTINVTGVYGNISVTAIATW